MFFRTKKNKKKDSGRIHERIEFYQASYYRINNVDNDNPKTSECWFNNISIGGISIDTKNKELDEGDEIKILYKIESKIRYDIAKIVFIKKAINNWRYGCQFTLKDTQRDKLIETYIKDNQLS